MGAHLTDKPLCGNLGGTTLFSGTPHPVKNCGFFVPIGYYPILARFGLYPGTKAPIRPAHRRTNMGSSLNTVVAANARHPSLSARVGLYQFNFDTGSNYAMTHHNTQTQNNSTAFAQHLDSLLDLATANSLRLSALDSLLAIARQAGEDRPLTGGEISALLEPLQADLLAFYERAESLLQASQAMEEPQAEPAPYLLRSFVVTAHVDGASCRIYEAVRWGKFTSESMTFDNKADALEWARGGN